MSALCSWELTWFESIWVTCTRLYKPSFRLVVTFNFIDSLLGFILRRFLEPGSSCWLLFPRTISSCFFQRFRTFPGTTEPSCWLFLSRTISSCFFRRSWTFPGTTEPSYWLLLFRTISSIFCRLSRTFPRTSLEQTMEGGERTFNKKSFLFLLLICSGLSGGSSGSGGRDGRGGNGGSGLSRGSGHSGGGIGSSVAQTCIEEILWEHYWISFMDFFYSQLTRRRE